MDGGRPPGATVEPHDRARASSRRDVEPVRTDADGAKAALDRITIPQDALDRIGNIAPRSSLIVTDEALSPETGKGTEFVVVLSGEPQGALKKRRRSPPDRIPLRAPTQLAFWRSPSKVAFPPGEPAAPHPEEPCVARRAKQGVSKDVARAGASWFETREDRAPHHEGFLRAAAPLNERPSRRAQRIACRIPEFCCGARISCWHLSDVASVTRDVRSPGSVALTCVKRCLGFCDDDGGITRR